MPGFLLSDYILHTCIQFMRGFLAHLSYAQDELVITFCSSSVRASVRLLIFSNDFSSEATEPILVEFHMEAR